MRTIIELPDEQISGLANYCEDEQISRAEAIRRAIARMLADREESTRQRDAALRAAFGAWKHKGIDGVEYQRALRAEWDR